MSQDAAPPPAPQVVPVTVDSKNPLDEDFKTYITQAMKDWNIPGMAIAVVDGDNIYAEGYGFASIEDKKPFTPETLAGWGSTTKAQVMAVLAQMIDSGKYPQLAKGWKTTICSIIRDDFVLQDEWVTLNTTLEDAACHRTGMGSHDYACYPFEVNGRPATTRDYVRNMRNLPMTDLSPRTQPHYCNIMYLTLGYVIEVLAGKPLAQVLKEMLWAPLGMNDTCTTNKEAYDSPRGYAKSYAWDAEKGEFIEKLVPDIAFAGGAGFNISNVLDYAKWIKCLLHQSEPLSKAVHNDMRRGRVIYSPTRNEFLGPIHYGLGWFDSDIYGGVPLVWHSGSTQTFACNLYWLPGVKFGVCAIHNAFMGYNAIPTLSMRYLFERKLNIPLDQRVDTQAQLVKDKTTAEKVPQEREEALFGKDLKDAPPSRCPIETLAGKYHDDGYGTIELLVKEDPKDASKQILWADRTNFIFPGQLILRHKSGDYWVMNWLPLLGIPEIGMEVWKAQFLFGVDGAATGLTVRIENGDVFEGDVLFKRRK